MWSWLLLWLSFNSEQCYCLCIVLDASCSTRDIHDCLAVVTVTVLICNMLLMLSRFSSHPHMKTNIILTAAAAAATAPLQLLLLLLVLVLVLLLTPTPTPATATSTVSKERSTRGNIAIAQHKGCYSAWSRASIHTAGKSMTVASSAATSRLLLQYCYCQSFAKKPGAMSATVPVAPQRWRSCSWTTAAAWVRGRRLFGTGVLVHWGIQPTPPSSLALLNLW